MEASMITPHEVLLAVGLACAGSGWFAHMAWNGFQNWLDDRAEARTPEGRARLLAEREHDDAWEASQAGAMDTLGKLAAGERVPAEPGPLRHAESRTAALAAIADPRAAAEPHGGPDALREGMDAQRRELDPLPQAHPAYAGADDRFTDGTGPQDAVAAEISGVGAMLAVPKDRRENLGPDTAEFEAVIADRDRHHAAIGNERSKWGFVPVRMGTPPHGMPIMDAGFAARYHDDPYGYRSGQPAAPAPALEALDWDSRRLSALLAKADRVTGPKADWDLLARQAHSRELAHA
jgi:hypothetical protein